MKVSELFLYPIKSFQGIPISKMAFDSKGPVGDRRYMVIGPDGQFLTQREFPQMALLRTRINEDDQRSVSIALPTGEEWYQLQDNEENELAQSSVWKFSGLMIKQNKSVNDFVSDFLKQKVSLVRMPNNLFRQVNPNFVPEDRSFDLSLADGYPLLLVNENSLKELNIQNPTNPTNPSIKMSRFRPNIVISGKIDPFQEESFQNITIGNIPFKVTKRCPRCVIINTNQETGERDLNLLKILASQKNQEIGVEKGVNFGIYLVPLEHLEPRVIQVGDKIF